MSDMKTIGTGNPLEQAALAIPPLHIPDGDGGCYKTELVVRRDMDGVEKIQWWHAPDPRKEPHNHPWKDGAGIAFRSTILSGGYIETRYWKEGNAVRSEIRSYHQGDVNVMPHNVFHTVDSVEPGTHTRMVTGPVVEGGDWGYLIDGQYVSAKDDPYPNTLFFKQLCEINPHKAPKCPTPQ